MRETKSYLVVRTWRSQSVLIVERIPTAAAARVSCQPHTFSSSSMKHTTRETYTITILRGMRSRVRLRRMMTVSVGVAGRLMVLLVLLMVGLTGITATAAAAVRRPLHMSSKPSVSKRPSVSKHPMQLEDSLVLLWCGIIRGRILLLRGITRIWRVVGHRWVSRTR